MYSVNQSTTSPTSQNPTTKLTKAPFQLVDKCLALCDPKLSAYLLSKGMHAELYAFPSVLTLCACTPPLPEVLHIWDFLFAYGAHLNVLCIVAQLCLARDTIMESPRYVVNPCTG
jgi:cell cycle arrest protein BUB2